MEWFNEYAHTCDGCKRMYADRKPPQTPPCNTCRVELMEGNEDAAQVYMLCRGQIITLRIGEKDVIYEISNTAIDVAMNWAGVKDENKLECANRVRRLFFEFKEREEN